MALVARSTTTTNTKLYLHYTDVGIKFGDNKSFEVVAAKLVENISKFTGESEKQLVLEFRDRVFFTNHTTALNLCKSFGVRTIENLVSKSILFCVSYRQEGILSPMIVLDFEYSALLYDKNSSSPKTTASKNNRKKK
jgi:hypothetical protein